MDLAQLLATALDRLSTSASVQIERLLEALSSRPILIVADQRLTQGGHMPITSYYVNRQAQSNGDHEVHESGCTYLPTVENRIFLGVFVSCREAVMEARKHYSQVNGCYYCCPECHTS